MISVAAAQSNHEPSEPLQIFFGSVSPFLTSLRRSQWATRLKTTVLRSVGGSSGAATEKMSNNSAAAKRSAATFGEDELACIDSERDQAKSLSENFILNDGGVVPDVDGFDCDCGNLRER